MTIITKTFIGLLTSIACSLALSTNIYISCTSNLDYDYIQMRLNLRGFNVTEPEQAQFDLCFSQGTQSQVLYSPSAYMGYGYYPRFHGHHHHYYGLTYDPFYDAHSFVQNVNIPTLQLSIKNRQDQTIWQEEKVVSKNTDDTVRELINHIPLLFDHNNKAMDYSLQDFQKNRISTEEFEKIRLR